MQLTRKSERQAAECLRSISMAKAYLYRKKATLPPSADVKRAMGIFEQTVGSVHLTQSTFCSKFKTGKSRKGNVSKNKE